LRMTKNSKSLEGTHLFNGQSYTVIGFTKTGDIRLSNGTTLGKDSGNFAYGYYRTSHASQGKDAQDVFIAQSAASFGASNEKQFYVSASRGEQRCFIYTDNKAELKQAVSRSADRMTASEIAKANHQAKTLQFTQKQIWMRRVQHYYSTKIRPFYERKSYRRIAPEILWSVNLPGIHEDVTQGTPDREVISVFMLSRADSIRIVLKIIKKIHTPTFR